MTDAIVELLEDLVRHPVRTVLTTLSVAWGTFVLVVLLGAGQGLSNQVEWQFRDDATNSLWIRRGERSLAFEGQKVGAPIRFDNRDVDVLRALDGVEHLTGRFYQRGGSQVTWGDRTETFDIRSVHPDHRHLENTVLLEGRWLSDRDLDARRKVAVVGEEVVRILFRDAPTDQILGTWITISGVAFRVVGVFTDTGGPGEQAKIYLPITTAQAAFSGGRDVDMLMFTLEDASAEGAAAMEGRVRALLGERKHFDPRDRLAVRISNRVEDYLEVRRILDMLTLFTWIVGIGTVLAGIVGVGNIMLVSVEERRAELGLRKAVGATPASLVGMVVLQTVVLTATAGYGGMVTGIGLLEAVRRLVPENPYVRDPEVQLGVALAATGLLVAAGTLAGLFPAWRAASVDPITALRDG